MYHRIHDAKISYLKHLVQNLNDQLLNLNVLPSNLEVDEALNGRN